MGGEDTEEILGSVGGGDGEVIVPVDTIAGR